MADGRKSKPMDIFAGEPRSADTDLVIVKAFEGQASALANWSPATGGEIDHAVASKEFIGKLFETFVTPIVEGCYRARRLAAIGLGEEKSFTIDRARRVAAAIGHTARHRKVPRIAFLADTGLDSPEMIQAIAEGLTLAEFDAGRYKTAGYDRFELASVGLIVEERLREVAERAARRGRIIGEHCNIARQLDNEPGNALTPSVFANRLAEIARSGGLSVEGLDHHELQRLRLGELLRVGRGSAGPPRFGCLRD